MTDNLSGDRLYTLAEAARWLGVSRMTVNRLVQNGKLIPTVKGKRGAGNDHKLSDSLIGKLYRYLNDKKELEGRIVRD